jgi:hypothetical protein
MQIKIDISGLDKVRAQLGSMAKQANYAAMQALNTTAFAINTKLKTEMSNTFAGGATPYSLRAFEVEKAGKQNLIATVALRTDNRGAALPYNKALAHMFMGGRRNYKKIEGLLLARKLMPAGLTIAPGNAMKLDKFGNMNRNQLSEMLTMLLARPSNMRTIRKTGRGKTPKMIDYFVVQPGAKTRLHPGIYKRIETGKGSAIDAMILFIRPVNYRGRIDLQKLGNEVVAKTFQGAFDAELAKALASAKP